MIRLLCVTDSPADTFCAQQMSLLVKQLPPQDFDVRVCVLGPDFSDRPAWEQANLPVMMVERRAGFPWPAYWGLASFVRRLRPDLVHCWGLSPALASCLRWICETTTVNTIFESTDSASSNLPAQQMAAHRSVPERLRAATSVDCVITHSQTMTGNLRAVRRQIIPPGMTRAEVCKPSVLRRDLGLATDRKVIGLMTEMEVVDRAKDALWAMDLMQAVHDDVDLIVYGNGPTSRRLKKYARQVDVIDRVYFLDGEICDVANFYSLLDLLWEPSIRHRVAASLLGAMIRGIPIVAADTPITNELLGNSRGVLVMAGHRAGFARQTQHLLANPDRAAEFADAARGYATREFSSESFVHRHAGLYRELSPTAAV